MAVYRSSLPLPATRQKKLKKNYEFTHFFRKQKNSCRHNHRGAILFCVHWNIHSLARDHDDSADLHLLPSVDSYRRLASESKPLQPGLDCFEDQSTFCFRCPADWRQTCSPSPTGFWQGAQHLAGTLCWRRRSSVGILITCSKRSHGKPSPCRMGMTTLVLGGKRRKTASLDLNRREFWP